MASLLAAKQCDQIRHNFQIWEKLSQLTKVKDNFSHFLFLKMDHGEPLWLSGRVMK
jgi:hypothetical protein